MGDERYSQSGLSLLLTRIEQMLTLHLGMTSFSHRLLGRNSGRNERTLSRDWFKAMGAKNPTNKHFREDWPGARLMKELLFDSGESLKFQPNLWNNITVGRP
jgi:hypothetical protein